MKVLKTYQGSVVMNLIDSGAPIRTALRCCGNDTYIKVFTVDIYFGDPNKYI